MSILLDTHAILWWQAGGQRLSPVARRALDDAAQILVSPLSLWEIATLHRRGRVLFDRDVLAWCHDLLASTRVASAATSPEAAAWAGTLPDSFPGDPIDRLLYATARDFRVPFLTKDERLHGYKPASREVALVW